MSRHHNFNHFFSEKKSCDAKMLISTNREPNLRNKALESANDGSSGSRTQRSVSSPAALLLLLRGEDVAGELHDVFSPQSRQLAQSALQLPAPPLQQLPQATVVTLDLVPFLLVPTGPTL